jgi:microcompartment protein CcmL/EutN
MSPVGRLFFEIGGDTSRLNASLQEAVRIAQDAGVKVIRTVIAVLERWASYLERSSNEA